MTDLVGTIWDEVGTVQPGLSTPVSALVLLAALLLLTWPPSDRWVRRGVTVAHEAGHAVTALAVGRRLSGIRIHADTSGVTISRGRARGPGAVATLAAGHPAPALLGLAGAAVLAQGYVLGLLWAVVLVTALLVLVVRNLYGLGVLLVLGVLVALAGWSLPGAVLSWTAHLVVLAVLLAAPRSVLESSRRGRARDPQADAGQLAGLTGVPVLLWHALFLLVTLGCAVLGVHLLAPW